MVFVGKKFRTTIQRKMSSEFCDAKADRNCKAAIILFCVISEKKKKLGDSGRKIQLNVEFNQIAVIM